MTKKLKRTVSPTFEVLKLMADGKLRSPAEMSTELDMPLNQVTNALQRLRKTNSMRLMPTPYQMTPTGRERLQDRLDEAERVKAREAAKAARPRRSVGRPRKPGIVCAPLPRPDDAFHHLVVAAPAVADSIVSTAVLGRHPLQTVWGSAHA